MPAAKTEILNPSRRPAIADVLAPLNELARSSCSLIAAEGGKFETLQQSCEVSRYLFLGPKGGSDTIRLGLFAGIHVMNPKVARVDEAEPQLATGYCLFIYPICNPTGSKIAPGNRGVAKI